MRLLLRLLPPAGLFWLAAGCETVIVNERRGPHGSDEVCAPFDDVTDSMPVTFRFRNETGLDIYLPALCAAAGLNIEGPNPTSIYPLQAAGHCLQTCEELRSEPWSDCGSEYDELRCSPWSFKIPAGATREIVWPGTTIVTQTMPGSCWHSADSSNLCSQLVAMPSGTLKLHKDAYTACEGECECDDNGICRGSPSGVPNAPDMLEFQYPDDDGIVDVVFDACTFGCAGG